MNRIYPILRLASVPAATLLMWMGHTVTVWAQEEQASSGGRVWMLGYGLVLFTIGLGVYAVCKPGSRKKIRKED